MRGILVITLYIVKTIILYYCNYGFCNMCNVYNYLNNVNSLRSEIVGALKYLKRSTIVRALNF